MAEGEHGGGLKGFLGKETAGLPNWAWLVVIVAGIGAAVVLPKLLGGSSSSKQDNSQSGQDPSQQASGLGLAIDPTTGLPYAVEGLVPGGGTAGTTTTQATADFTATNNLLQQILAAVQSPPTKPAPGPVVPPDNDKKPKTPPTHTKTTNPAKVDVTAPLPPTTRPSGPTQPAEPVANPVAKAPKRAPVTLVTGSGQKTVVNVQKIAQQQNQTTAIQRPVRGVRTAF